MDTCVVMPTPFECICCHEIRTIADKTGTSESSSIQCITEHEGFEVVCLNVWVLQTSYFTLTTLWNMGYKRRTTTRVSLSYI